MNITLLLQHKVFGAISTVLGRWLHAAPAPARTLQHEEVAPNLIAACAHSTGAAGLKHVNSPARPLRVVRVVDAGQSRSSVGRMVISGRMADVCAELDRLAAHEAAMA